MGKLAKVAEGAAQNGDGAGRVIGLAPHAWVAAKHRCGARGKVTQATGVVERCKRAQAGRFGVVHVLQRACGCGVQQRT